MPTTTSKMRMRQQLDMQEMEADESTFYVSGFKMIQQWESGNLMRGYCERADLVWFVLWTFTYIDPWLLNLLILLHLKVLLREVLGKIGVLSAIKTL